MQAIHLDAPPLVVHDDGVIRVAGTRVTLEAIVIAFDAGATPEEIVQKYPTIGLSAVYSVCAYVLAHRAEVDKYVLAKRSGGSAGPGRDGCALPAHGHSGPPPRSSPSSAVMLRLAIDECVDNDIVSGVLRMSATVDFVREQDAGLAGADDPTVLPWAAHEKRVLVTHDLATMIRFAYERVFARRRSRAGWSGFRICRGW